MVDLIICLQTADPGRFLQSMRTLRDYAAKGCWEAQVCMENCIQNLPHLVLIHIFYLNAHDKVIFLFLLQKYLF